MGLASNASMFLIIIGAASALFGAVASATQPVIKTSLAYSSIGHMGFSLMVSGFGVYSASLLHLVAHSFYKAHAFLSSGSIIEKVQTKNASEFVRQFNVWKIVLGTVVTITTYGLIAYFWDVNENTPFQLLVIGCVIFLGVLSLQINALDSNNKIRSAIGLVLGAAVVVNLFFFLESTVHAILHSQIPSIASPSSPIVAVSTGILIVFFLVVLIQLLPQSFRNQKIAQQVHVHLRNGLYFNQLFDKMTRSLHRTTSSNTYQ
jgi:NAD(P)H-quinone oxidoreductase subunit 5